MKKIALIGLLLGTFMMVVQAQSGNTDLSEYGKDGWLVLVDEAYAESKKTGKPIMANFTGSDWCGWCKRLSAAVFDKPEFKSWAEENVVLLELDFPRRKQLPEELRQQNAGLQRAFKVQGFPTIWVFDLDKDAESGKYAIKALGKTGYRPTVAEFIGGVDQMIEKAAAAGR